MAGSAVLTLYVRRRRLLAKMATMSDENTPPECERCGDEFTHDADETPPLCDNCARAIAKAAWDNRHEPAVVAMGEIALAMAFPAG